MSGQHGHVGALLSGVGLDDAPLDRLTLTGDDPMLPSSFRCGTSAQASIAALAVAAAELHHLRGGPRQDIAVDMRHAAAEFRSERYLRIDGKVLELWDRLSGAYRCGDGRWVRLHMLMPHHSNGVLELLGCEGDRAAIARALLSWKAADFEDAASARGYVVALMRSLEEWDAHPEGQAVAAMPPITIERIGDALPEPLPPAARPLGGVRVIDLTRVIAGPVCGRALAAHGAEVLHITSPKLPFTLPFIIDSGRGKLSAQLDLTTEADRAKLRELSAGTDVFLQSYRPGSLAAKGFTPEELATIRPGIVYVTLSAYSRSGPWKDKRGFDSLVQTTGGLNHAEAIAKGIDEPLPLPCQVQDHASGYFLALGAIAALRRRAIEGGSWRVHVSLAATAIWLRSLGRLPDGFSAPDISFGDIGDLLYDSPSGFGTLTSVRHAAILSETPARWEQPSVPLGTHPPAWSTGAV